MVPFAQLSAQLQQPCKSVRAFETGAALPPEIRRFLFQILRGQALNQRFARGFCEGRIRERTHQPDEQPMPVH